MKKDEMTPEFVIIFSIFASVTGLICSDFGRGFVGYSGAGETGLFIVIIALISPIFIKKFRKTLWSKKGLLLLSLALLINLPLAIISLKNEYGF